MRLCCGKQKFDYKIIKIYGSDKNKFSNLGFTPNTIITMVKHSYKKGPIVIKIRGYIIALRHNEAECIEVEIT